MSSNSLTSLPDDHPCNGCRHNCCDPVYAGYEGHLWFPMPDPSCDQLIAEKEAELKALIHYFIQTTLSVSPDHRFSLKGIVLGDGHVLGEDTELSVVADKIIIVRLHLKLLLNCDAFDKEHRVCLRHEDRPDMCRSVSFKACYFSKVAELPVSTDDGLPFTVEELLERYATVFSVAKPTPDEAIAALKERLNLLSARIRDGRTVLEPRK